ncbi:MAG: hypothetical protein ACE5IK_02805 [Acidobacteriota bacterium]
MNRSRRIFGIPTGQMLAWVGAAALVRVGAWWWAGSDLPCSFDGCSYLDLAHQMAAGVDLGPEQGFLWPPGFPAFLALLAPPAGSTAGLARLVQACLGALLVVPTAAFAALLTRADAVSPGQPTNAGALAPAGQAPVVHLALAFTAFDPTLVAFSHLLWPETIFLVLLTTSITCIIACERLHGWLVAGATLGGAALFKAIGFWLALPVLAVRMLDRARPGGWRVPALVLGAALLVISPWTIRNAIRYGRFVFIDVTLGTNLYLGNSDAAPVTWDWGTPQRSRARASRGRCQEGDFIDRNRCEVRRAVGWIADHPRAFASRAVTKWADLLNPTSFLVRQVRAGRYRGMPMARVSRGAAALATMAAAVPWMALVVLAIVGLWVPSAPVPRRAVVAMILSLLLIHALTFGMSRFRLPMVPFLAGYAGLALWRMRDGRWWPRQPNDRASLLVLLLTVGYLWGLRLSPLLDLNPFTGLQ